MNLEISIYLSIYLDDRIDDEDEGEFENLMGVSKDSSKVLNLSKRV